MNLDPKGYYALLGVGTHAGPSDIIAAYRRQARVLHPDVPETGNAERFIAVKQAYDVLSDPGQRAAYDRTARVALMDSIEPEDLGVPMAPDIVEPPTRRPRLSDMPIAVWLSLGLVVVVSVYQLAIRLTEAPSPSVSIPPTAPPAAPANPAQTAAPRLPRQPVGPGGTPNHYTIPMQGLTTVWRVEAGTNRLVVVGHLQPFTPVQALRLFRQPGLMEIRLSDTESGMVQAARLTVGNQAAARRAFCSYHAGVRPHGGEVLKQRGEGRGSLALHNRSHIPAVVKLRDRAGSTAAAIYLSPRQDFRVDGLPEGLYRVEYAFGDIWSRGCNSFALGVQAWRMASFRSLAALTPLAIPPDADTTEPPVEIPDQAFNRD